MTNGKNKDTSSTTKGKDTTAKPEVFGIHGNDVQPAVFGIHGNDARPEVFGIHGNDESKGHNKDKDKAPGAKLGAKKP